MTNRSVGNKHLSLADMSSNGELRKRDSLLSPGYLVAAEALAHASVHSDSPYSTKSGSMFLHSGGTDPDLDSLDQTYRRKMQRRQANRKSAQLSRARKKAHLEELKEENSKLQHVADILNSQAEFIFSFNLKGTITHIPERIVNMIKSAADDPDEDITNISQILTPESVLTLMDSIKELSGKDKGQAVTFVKEVYYHDATGFPVAGFMRCSKLNRKKRTYGKVQGDDGNNSSDSDTSDEKGTQKNRSSKKSSGHRTNGVLDGFADDTCHVGTDAEEYVCVIRPASSSSPFLNNLHLLSAASMVAHDSISNKSSKVNGDGFRKRSDSPSDGSNSSGVPHSSLTTDQTKDSTNSSAGTNSSEDRSNHSEENNGSEDNDCQSRNSGSDNDNLVQ